MATEQALPEDHPEVKAFREYQATPAFVNSYKWAAVEGSAREGSLWAAFDQGWRMALASRPTEKAEENLDWDVAKRHLDNVLQEYTSIMGMPGTNVMFALSFVLQPLMARYHSGERTKQLYDEMMATK